MSDQSDPGPPPDLPQPRKPRTEYRHKPWLAVVSIIAFLVISLFLFMIFSLSGESLAVRLHHMHEFFLGGVVIPVFIVFILVPLILIIGYWKMARIKFKDLDGIPGHICYNIFRCRRIEGYWVITSMRDGRPWELIFNCQNAPKIRLTFDLVNCVAVREDVINRKIYLETRQMEITTDQALREINKLQDKRIAGYERYIDKIMASQEYRFLQTAPEVKDVHPKPE